MSRPLIGITVVPQRNAADARTGGSLTLNWNYADAVLGAGGNPVLLPPQVVVEELVPILDGVLIPGGKDIDPSLYGEPKHASADLESKERFDLERRLFEILPPDFPFLGICYGCQLLNVLRGGNLAQHLPDSLGNDRHTHGEVQEYAVAAGSQLGGLLGDRASGQSWHHQAVAALGENLAVVATSADGTIEAIEATDRAWTIGVQWHPERTPEGATSSRLLTAFVEAAREYRAHRSAGVTA